MGDALFRLPAIAAIRTAFPDHHVTWVAGGDKSIFCRELRPLISDHVDEIVENAQLGVKWRELFGPTPINGQFYDIVIDTQTVIRATLCLRRIKHNTFISPAASFFFSDRKPVSRGGLNASVQKQFLSLLSLASGKDLKPVYALPIPQQYRDAALELLPSGPIYIGLAPGSGGKNRCWPLSNYLEIARRQQQAGRTPVFFIGPEELGWVDKITAAVPGAYLPEQTASKKFKNISGPLLSIALAERIAVGVANNSGPGHILAAAGRPLILLFGGPYSPEKFFQPSAKKRLLRAQDFGGKDMTAIPTVAVQDAIENLLQASK